jgi:hypothetical protein
MLGIGLRAAADSALAAPDWDIVGLRLGMTEAEARTAFQADDAKGKIVATQSGFAYSDKVDSFRTPPFLNSLELRVVRQGLRACRRRQQHAGVGGGGQALLPEP